MNQGIVDADGGGSVNKRSGPGTGYTGRWGTTSLWNRLTDGTRVSDAFVWTGAAFPVNGWC